MQIEIKEYTPDREGELVDLLTSQRWDYHSTHKITKEKVFEQLKNGYYAGSETRTFLIAAGNEKAVGMIRLFDLGPNVNDDKETPLFDIRLNAESRSKGIGCEAVKWITNFVFTNYPKKHRFEATTRADNIAMRKVLDKCGFVKEAHYREAWPDAEGMRYDCAGYSILKKDWQNKTKTPVNFEDAI